MEKYLMSKFKEILEQNEDITDVKMFTNLEGEYIITYMVGNAKYILSNELLEIELEENTI